MFFYYTYINGFVSYADKTSKVLERSQLADEAKGYSFKKYKQRDDWLSGRAPHSH